MVGDGNAVSVASQIVEDMFWPAEGRLSVDDPLMTEKQPEPGCEGSGLGQRDEMAVELELALLEGLSQMNQEPFAEEGTQDLDGKEEGFAILSASDPP